ncbi:unnamed protein product [Brachionus calyciflorus]|uniref:CCHC-type domain-containing protein n=1 Tax=Brachionus calyciflorus TaxID=104777 RepID=A0A814F332_9BILA|nr:unnamed protein product [Brachionus calyciflorus]
MFSNGRLQFNGESKDVDNFIKLFIYESLMFNWDRAAQVRAIECCLVGKALQIFNNLSQSQKTDIDEIIKALKSGCKKSPDFYLNLFYARTLKPDESIATFCHEIEGLLWKGMPGLEEASKSSLLRARFFANIPENVKNFMELLSDKSWKELVTIFDKSVDYKSISTKVDDEAVLVNKLNAVSFKSQSQKFNGSCFYCKRPGHRTSECRKKQYDEKTNQEVDNQVMIVLKDRTHFTVKEESTGTIEINRMHFSHSTTIKFSNTPIDLPMTKSDNFSGQVYELNCNSHVNMNYITPSWELNSSINNLEHANDMLNNHPDVSILLNDTDDNFVGKKHNKSDETISEIDDSFFNYQPVESSVRNDSEDNLGANLINKFDEIDLDEEKLFYNALLILFYTTGISQSAFRIICEFMKILKKLEFSFEIPSNFEQTSSNANLNDFDSKFTKYWFCNKCIKKFENVENKLRNVCSACGQKLQMDYKLCIESQIRNIFKANSLEKHVHSHEISDFLEDINDGLIYNNVLKNETKNFFTFLLNTDGISISEKSRLSIWPIFLTINEIPITTRYCLENVIIAGLSVSFGKPDLSHLLGLIKSDLLKFEYGINLGSTDFENYKFFLISAVFDKPARAAVLNTINSNDSSIQTYPYIKENPDGPKRDLKSYVDDLKIVVQTREKFNGIKGKCPLDGLKYFNPVINTNIDGMHSIFLGVVKTLFSYWFDSPSEKRYSLKDKMNMIEENLSKIKPPGFIKTAPRSIYDWKLWRAYEFMSFLMNYSLIVFNRIMRIEYINNLILLVISLENLYDRRICKSKLENVKGLLNQFVQELADLYDPFILKSGFHELLHLSECSIYFGPLNSTNCYKFEELNRKITRLIKGQNLIGEEFIKLFSVWQNLSITLNSCNTLENSYFRIFFENNAGLKTSNKKKVEELHNLAFSTKRYLIKNVLISEIFEKTYSIKIKEFSGIYNVSFNGNTYTDKTKSTRFCEFSIHDPEKVVNKKIHYSFDKKKPEQINNLTSNQSNNEKTIVNESNKNNSKDLEELDLFCKSSSLNDKNKAEKLTTSQKSNSKITIEKMNKIKVTEQQNKFEKINESSKLNTHKPNTSKHFENYLLIQWLSDKMFDIVETKKVKISNINSILEGETYDVMYGNIYLKAVVKLKGRKVDCEQQLKILRNYDLNEKNNKKKRRVNSEEDLTFGSSNNELENDHQIKNKHLETKLIEMEDALKSEKIKNQELENELKSAKEMINCLKSTYDDNRLAKIKEMSINFLKIFSTFEEISEIGFYSTEKRGNIHYLSSNYKKITISNEVKTEIESLVENSKSPSECFRKVISIIIPDPVIWAGSTIDKMFRLYNDEIYASFGNIF